MLHLITYNKGKSIDTLIRDVKNPRQLALGLRLTEILDTSARHGYRHRENRTTYIMTKEEWDIFDSLYDSLHDELDEVGQTMLEDLYIHVRNNREIITVQ